MAEEFLFVTILSSHARRTDYFSVIKLWIPLRRLRDTIATTLKCNVYQNLTIKEVNIVKKITLACALASALIMNCTNASASTVFQLNETFQSGATFAGSVTFSDALDNLLGVTGTLVGGSVGATSDKVNWTWYEGGSQKASGTFAANTNAHFDWLMDGTNSSNYSHRIELDWINTGGVITLTNAYGSGSSGSKANAIDSWDPMVSYGITAAVPEPEAYGMLLVGLGLLGFVANRRKSRS